VGKFTAAAWKAADARTASLDAVFRRPLSSPRVANERRIDSKC
jgi:hypothetical protein